MSKTFQVIAKNVPVTISKFNLIMKYLAKNSLENRVTKTKAICEVIDYYFEMKLTGEDKES